MERHRRGGLTFDYTRLIVRPRGETLDPLESQSGVLIFCGSVKLPIKYSSRLFNCRNKEEQRASRSPTAIRGYDALRQPFQTPLNARRRREKRRRRGRRRRKRRGGRECLHERNTAAVYQGRWMIAIASNSVKVRFNKTRRLSLR